MSIQAVELAFLHSRSRNGARLVLLALASHADERMEAWPSVETLRLKAGLDHGRSVTRCLRELENMGEVVRVGMARAGVTKYRLVLGTPDTQVTPSDAHPLTCRSPDLYVTPDLGVTPTPDPQVTPWPSTPDTQVTTPLTCGSPEPSVIENKVGKARKRATPIPDGWVPSPTDRHYAETRFREWQARTGLSPPELETEAEKFGDYHAAKGSRHADWSAAWRNWVRTAMEIKEDRAAKPLRRVDTLAPKRQSQRPQAHDLIPEVLT